jgi:hypothetical protein
MANWVRFYFLRSFATGSAGGWTKEGAKRREKGEKRRGEERERER